METYRKRCPVRVADSRIERQLSKSLGPGFDVVEQGDMGRRQREGRITSSKAGSGARYKSERGREEG